MTRHEFTSAEGLQGQLDELLKNPILQVAIEIVSKEGVSRALPRPVPGVSYAEQMAAEGAITIGWAGALAALVSLTKKPALTRATNLNQNSMYITEAKKRMMESDTYSESEVEQYAK